MPVRKTGQLPENIDRQVNEIIRAFSEMEEQVRQIRKASDPRIGDNAEYIDRHVRNLKNPHSVTAKQVKALPLAFVLDPSSICFPFQNSLVSTRGETPIGLYGSSITDYGLVTGNDLCATLLPEGGVAVTEETANGIQNGNFATGDFTGWTNYGSGGTKSIVNHNGINYARIEIPASETAIRFGINSTKNISVLAGDKVTISFRMRGDKPNYAYLMCSAGGNISIDYLLNYITLSNGELLGYYTWEADRSADVGFMFTYSGTIGSVGEFTFAQLEKSPYRTPYVDGTRPAGVLSYPISGTGGRLTLSATFTCNGDDYNVDTSIILRAVNTRAANSGFYLLGTGPSGSNKLKLDYMLNGQWTDLYSGIDTKNGTKQKLTLVVDRTNVYIYQDGSLLWSGTVPMVIDFDRVEFLGVKTQTYENTLICPYAVTPETVATWHSLDAPFIDPFIPPSQGVPYFNTPGEFINSTANFAMVNVDGLVKLYARTPDETIIIETLGNMEVV